MTTYATALEQKPPIDITKLTGGGGREQVQGVRIKHAVEWSEYLDWNSLRTLCGIPAVTLIKISAEFTAHWPPQADQHDACPMCAALLQ